MAVRSRRPWLSVVVGVVLGFTAASWLVVPAVVELNGGGRRRSPACSHHRDGLGKVWEAGGSSSTTADRTWRREEREEVEEGVEESAPGTGNGDPQPRHFLYVGVMTAKKYLDSRAVAAHKTWTRSVPGKVEFFSSQGSDMVPLPAPVPVVSLPGVDDSYPPQKKSFMMLKYMHDHYLDKYEWFMRADDDVYIRGE